MPVAPTQAKVLPAPTHTHAASSPFSCRTASALLRMEVSGTSPPPNQCTMPVLWSRVTAFEPTVVVALTLPRSSNVLFDSSTLTCIALLDVNNHILPSVATSAVSHFCTLIVP